MDRRHAGCSNTFKGVARIQILPLRIQITENPERDDRVCVEFDTRLKNVEQLIIVVPNNDL
jgi:hypothetical protein